VLKLNKDAFRGVIVPLLTPFKPTGQLDLDAMALLMDWLSRQRVDMFFLMGGSGEWQTLTLAERKDMIEAALQVKCPIPIVPNVGSEDLADTLRLRDFAVRAGAPAIGLVIPESIRPSQDGLLAFVSAVCEACEIPVMLYDPRGEGTRSPTPTTMRRIAEEIPNVVAMKYRTTDAERMARMCGEVGETIRILSGVETVYLSDLVYGAVGVVGGGGNLWPNLLAEIGQAFAVGDWRRARELQFLTIGLNDGLGVVPWPLSGKLALRALGLPIEPAVRVGPKVQVREADVRAIETVVRNCAWTVPFSG
jgi:4-hydroxy-tetrahydrodipicolinate synthase